LQITYLLTHKNEAKTNSTAVPSDMTVKNIENLNAYFGMYLLI
jgi:hypothetical protein